MADAKNAQPVAATPVAPPRQFGRREVLGMLGAAFALAAGGPLLEACSKPKTRRPVETYEQQMQRLIPSEWRTAAAQLEGREHLVLSNLKAFSELGEALTASERGKAFLSGKNELTILYPGSGEHLSPLEFVMKLADGAPNLGKVKLIYTEICKDCYERIDKDVAAVVQAVPGLGNLSVEVKEDCNPGKEKTMRFSYTTSSGKRVEIELLFAFERGGEDGAYYRQEHFQSADILLSHDIGESTKAPAIATNMFAGSLAKEGGGSRERVWLMEYSYGQPYQRDLLYDGLGHAELVEAPFGCGPNHLEQGGAKRIRSPLFKYAAAIYPDMELFRELSARHLMVPYGRILTFADSDMSEPMQLQTAEGSRTQEKTDGYRAAYNSSLASLLRGLPGLSATAQAKLSKILLTSIGSSFNLDIFSDEAVLPGLRTVTRDYLDSYEGYDFNTSLRDFIQFRQGRFLDFQNHVLSLLACYITASNAGDAEALAKLKTIVQSELSQLDKQQISGLLASAAQFRHAVESGSQRLGEQRGRSMGMRDEGDGSISVKFEKDGLSVVEIDARGIEGLFSTTTQTLMSFFYLANRLGCSGMEETKQFLSDEAGRINGNGPDRTYCELLYRVASE